MKKMIRMAMAAGLMVVAATTVAQAQGDPQQQGRRGGGGRGGFNLAILDSLKATDAQKAQVDSILKAYATMNAPLMEAARGGDADARTKMQANNAKRLEDIKALFNDEQKKQIDALMPVMGGRRGGPPPTGV